MPRSTTIVSSSAHLIAIGEPLSIGIVGGGPMRARTIGRSCVLRRVAAVATIHDVERSKWLAAASLMTLAAAATAAVDEAAATRWPGAGHKLGMIAGVEADAAALRVARHRRLCETVVWRLVGERAARTRAWRKAPARRRFCVIWRRIYNQSVNFKCCT